MIMHKALHSVNDIDYMCQKKKEEEDSPALKIIVNASVRDSGPVLALTS